MEYQDFADQMDDILSSGYGGELSDWHKEQLKELFAQIHPDLLKEYVKTFYTTNSTEGVTDEEIAFVCEQTGLTASMKVVFE